MCIGSCESECVLTVTVLDCPGCSVVSVDDDCCCLTSVTTGTVHSTNTSSIQFLPFTCLYLSDF